MTSTIKVNNILNQCGTAYIQRCGTTITLGTSGDNITLACGATQTGFGRTGTVNWDTTAKTTNFTAVSGTGYFVNTTSGAITMTLPASPSAGDIVSVADYANTFQTNNLIVANNSSPINGVSSNYTADTEGISLTFVYVDGTRGWKNINDGTTNATGVSPFIIATGGTETYCGDYKIHTFTGPGTFTVTSSGTPAGSTAADYIVIAGGGGGGGNCNSSSIGGAGGGAGGFRESHSAPVSGCYTASPLATPTGITLAATAYPITVGAGGASNQGGTPGDCASSGSNSVFSTITSTGGGGGMSRNSPREASYVPGHPGGSGAGVTGNSARTGGSGNTPPVAPPQGNNGGNSNPSPDSFGSSGGGGASAAAANVCAPTYGATAGGNGVTTSISATPTAYSGGGGGGGANAPASPLTTSASGGAGGTGGGGAGGNNPNVPGPAVGTAGTANTGGGGGAAAGGTGTFLLGGQGGSGIVIIRYKYQ